MNPLVFQLPHAQYGVHGFIVMNYDIWRIVRLIKLVKIRKINRQLGICIHMFKRDFKYESIVKFILQIVMVVHISACIWNLIGELQLFESWLDVAGNRYESIIITKYIETVYFALTVLLTVGYGNIRAFNTTERVILMAWMFCSVIIYAYIIGSLSSGFAKLNEKKTSKNEREEFYTNFAKVFNLPYQLLDQVLTTIGTQFSSTNTGWLKLYETNKLLTDLPKSLYGDICTHVYRELIEKIDFFQKKPKHFLVRILPLLKPANLSYGDEVYRTGDPSSEIFFIHKGRIASVCHDRHKKIRSQIFVQGAYFGECDIIYKRARASTAYAESNVALWKLNKEEFLSILEEFVDVKKDVYALAKIKETFRAPVVKAAESKVKEIIYAKKLLAKSKIKNPNRKPEATDSPVLKKRELGDLRLMKKPSFGEIFSPSVIVEKANIFSPDFRKVIAQKRKVGDYPSDSFLSTPQRKTELPENNSNEFPKKKNVSPRKVVTTPMLAKIIGKKSRFSEDYINMPEQIQSESMSNEGRGSGSKESTLELSTPPKFYELEERKSASQSEKQLADSIPMKKRSAFSSFGESKGLEPKNEVSREEKVKQQLLDYMNEKGISVEDYGFIEMLLQGRDSVVSSKDQFEKACNIAIEEIDQYAETESRIASSFGAYSEFLTELMENLRINK